MTPPKTKFTKEKILQAAFEILEKKGWKNVSARSIAAYLGASTMPIYSALDSMADLKEELQKRTYETVCFYQTRTYTKDPFLDSAVGYVKFAQEKPHLFSFLFLESPQPVSAQSVEELKNRLPEELRDRPLKDAFKETKKGGVTALLLNSWVFTHGLAALLYSGVLTGLSEKDIIRFLSGAGKAFSRGLKSKGKQKAQ
ncbi:MAG: TetR/AcrR family transcriptional regulator [Candidatus Aminicenantes bacterium]|nr:TetR/AcrR family transcriptional regulator [Candidatus Aminicenantes bacterium]